VIGVSNRTGVKHLNIHALQSSWGWCTRISYLQYTLLLTRNFGIYRMHKGSIPGRSRNVSLRHHALTGWIKPPVHEINSPERKSPSNINIKNAGSSTSNSHVSAAFRISTGPNYKRRYIREVLDAVFSQYFCTINSDGFECRWKLAFRVFH